MKFKAGEKLLLDVEFFILSGLSAFGLFNYIDWYESIHPPYEQTYGGVSGVMMGAAEKFDIPLLFLIILTIYLFFRMLGSIVTYLLERLGESR